MLVKRVALKIGMALALVCGANAAGASTASGGTISAISVEQGRLFFYVSGSRTATPPCHTVPGRWVFDASTAQGQAMMAALMTFYSQGKQVSVSGTNACANWPDTESVQYILLVN